MATNTPINARDLGLQSTIDRLLGVNTNYVSLSSPTLQFKYGTDNVAQPTQAIVTATLVGSLNGTVTFTTTGITPAPTSTTNTITILPDNITGDVATINASLNYLGNNYAAVPITITKIFNQLVATLSRPVDLIASYNDGTGYTLPGTNTISLLNGVVALTSGVTYGPATQSSLGLTATVNSTTGVITLSQTAPNTWTGNSASFTFTATRNLISYNVSYVITKAKQGQGGQQLAEVALYQWATAQPAAPTGTSQYTWISQGHTYSGTDTWTTTVPSNPGTAGIKLWKIVKSVAGESISTVASASITWLAGTTVRVITTEANELIKTYIATVYKNDTSLPTIAGTSTFTWSSSSISAAPSGWSLTAPDTQQGFTLFQATVSLLAAQTETSSTISWTNAAITPVRYYGADAVSPVTVALTNPYHVLPVNASSVVASYYGSSTDLIAYEGATPLVYDGIGTSKGSYKITQTGSSITPGAIVAQTVNNVTFAQAAASSSATFTTSQTGTVTYFVSGVRWTGQAFTYTVQQTVVKAVDSAVRYMLSTATIVTKNLAGQYNPTTVTFSLYAYTTGTPISYAGYFKIFENNDQVAKYSTGTGIAESSKAYTPSATASKIRVYLYSDAAFTTLLDQTVVYISKDGESGQTSAIGRTAYAVVTTTPSATPTSLTVTGDNPPTANTWFATTTWSTTAPTAALDSGESLYQSDGVYVIGGDTTWGAPYLSTLKVGNLSALTANTGNLNISGSIKGGLATSLTSGNGFYVDSSGNLRVGTPGGAQLKFDANGLVISNSAGLDIFTVVSTAQNAASASATSASTAATNATAALAVAGSTTWLGDAGIEIVTGTQLKKTLATNAWDVQRYSAESYVGGAYITFIPSNTTYHFMVGLDTNPTENASFSSIDHAWYCTGNGTLLIYESGQSTDPTLLYTNNTVLSIIYDGRYVKYYKDGTLIRSVDKGIASNIKYYADSSFNSQNSEVRSLRFGPVGSIGADGNPGTNATISIGTITTGSAGTSASVTNSGTSTAAVLNFTIPKGSDSTTAGPAGYRGSLTGYAINYGIYGGWADNKANRIISNLVTGETSTADLTTTTHLRITDTVTITNNSTTINSTAAVTKYWDGTAWVDLGVIFNGNVIVNGTISADKLAANSILVGHQIKNSSGTFIIDFGTNPYISISV